MNDDHGPAEPDGDASGQAAEGGFAAVAQRLNILHPARKRPISRQLVYKWYVHRSYNRFPEPAAMSGGGTGHPVFSLEAVEEWYISYRRHRGEALPPAATTTTTTSHKDVLAISGNEGENSLAA